MSEAAINFVSELFSKPGTQHEIYFSSLANERDGSTERRLSTRDPEQLAAFITKNNQPGRGLFVCCGTVEGRRNKDNVRESIGLFTDVDYKDHPGVPAEDIRKAINRAKRKPTIIVHTGHGLHLWWLFQAAVPTQEHRDRLEKALRALADHFGGDTQVAEISRLMRLPGTHNTKYDSWVEVAAEYNPDDRYTLEDLEQWLDTNTRPLLERRAAGPSTPRGAPPDSNPFTRLVEEQGYQPPIDVDALIAGMVYPGNVHATQVSVSAALLERGFAVEEVVARLVAETQKVAGTGKFNWGREERDLRKMCLTWLIKHPQPKSTPDKKADFVRQADNVADLGAERAKRKPAPAPEPKQKKSAAPFLVADLLVKHLREIGEDVMLAEGEAWLYKKGFWALVSPADEMRLRGMIMAGFEALKIAPNAGMLNLAWTRLMQNSELFKADVPWADAGMVVCRNGVLMLDTGAFEKHTPENFARRHIGATFTPGAKCPIFVALLESMFSNRGDATQLIALLQEWAGAALAIGSLSREQRRALILVGPSMTGKTELAKIFALLFGDPVATPSVAEIGEPRFGLSSLYGTCAWVRDDAINEGDKLDPQRFKTVVTGEAVDVGRRHRLPIPNVRFSIPVLLTCNSLPRARDGSDAIFNRSLVVEMTHVVDIETAKAARAAILGQDNVPSLGAGIFDAEAPGILNWALLGFARLRSRGFFDIPASVAGWIQGFKDENNPVGEWVRECVEAAPSYRVERSDLARAYNGWNHEQEGDEARPAGGRWLLPKVSKIIPGVGKYQAHTGRRYTTGLRLTKAGLAAWEGYAKAVSKPGGFSTNIGEVNQVHLPGEDDAGEG